MGPKGQNSAEPVPERVCPVGQMDEAAAPLVYGVSGVSTPRLTTLRPLLSALAVRHANVAEMLHCLTSDNTDPHYRLPQGTMARAGDGAARWAVYHGTLTSYE
ncbi:hypothetical protein J6590_020283 [Homalodisca vitripennis]|nr:hypothetical protein J6590_020283 [Homalodisca vitripennis]